MSEDIKAFFKKYQGDFSKMKKQMPETVSGFGGLFGNVMKDGAMGLLEKELTAVAIGVALKCQPCIKLHVKKSLEAGATAEQILEAASVAVMMAGGPAFVHLPVVIETLEALR